MSPCRVSLFLLFMLIGAGGALPALAADTTQETILYQSDFSQNPNWVTNSATRYYWDPSLEMYHFKAEGGTNGYAFVPIDYDGQTCTLDYDVVILSSDKNSAFRFGLISSEMDFSRGTNVLSCFENGKYGRLISLRVIDQNNMLREVTSYYSSYCSDVTGCNTVEFAENTTYHVTVRYNKDRQMADIKVTEKASGDMVWGYFVSVGRDLFFMDRLAITTRGDYAFGPFIEGYIDNVQLAGYTMVESTPTTPAPTLTPETTTPPATATPGTTQTPTPAPTTTPLPIYTALVALLISALLLISRATKNR